MPIIFGSGTLVTVLRQMADEVWEEVSHTTGQLGTKE